MEIKTIIPELEKMINETTRTITTYKNRPGLLEFEDYHYSKQEAALRKEIREELNKAKALMRSRKGWRWEVIKKTNFNPFKLWMLFMAWRQNKKHGDRIRTNN